MMENISFYGPLENLRYMSLIGYKEIAGNFKRLKQQSPHHLIAMQ